MHADVEKCCIIRTEVRSEFFREAARRTGNPYRDPWAFRERTFQRRRAAPCRPGFSRESPRAPGLLPTCPCQREAAPDLCRPGPCQREAAPGPLPTGPCQRGEFCRGGAVRKQRRLFRDPWAFREGGFFKAFEALFRPIPLSEARVRKRASRKR